MLVGVILAVLLPEMPFLGWLFMLLIIGFGLGSLVLFLWHLKNPAPAAEEE
jgi:hypothetical protein